MFAIAHNLQAVRALIHDAAQACGRASSSVNLLAVSKTFDAHAVWQAIQAGQTAFGENYLQEALDKMAELQILTPKTKLEWHFIGPIQSNKTRAIAENFSWVHSVEREKVAQRLSQQRPADLPPLNFCLQVNISGEASKSGVAPEDVVALAKSVAALPHLRLRGLMTIPAPSANAKQTHLAFQQMRELFLQLRDTLGLADFDTLSMGMSADLSIAIAEGSTMVRVGTAIFGARQPHPAATVKGA